MESRGTATQIVEEMKNNPPNNKHRQLSFNNLLDLFELKKELKFLIDMNIGILFQKNLKKFNSKDDRIFFARH